MKAPTERQTNIIISKINYYENQNYYGGLFTYYEIILLVEYFKVVTDDYGRQRVKWYRKAVKNGENDSTWFYFNLCGDNPLKQNLL